MKPQKDIFIKNSKSLRYNSLGHFSKEIEDIDLENHFIIVGDQAGLCDDVSVDSTFFHLTSKLLKMDYYNLCVKDGGLDAVKQNLIAWITYIGTPKAIVIACKQPNNFLRFDEKDKVFRPANLSLDGRKYNELIKYAGKDLKHERCSGGFFGSRTYLFSQILKYSIKIPIIELRWQEKTPKIAESSIEIDCEKNNINHKRLSRILSQRIRRSTRVINDNRIIK